ncbi:MAG TPA: WecB/TagA/CpsF family glycosyltransferase [Candidatus Dormibacteraeota bacterium]|nr:WecB/TagA/CpsF family glycosyltransferase [Candidatus Dormibacteraeota bacterium]
MTVALGVLLALPGGVLAAFSLYLLTLALASRTYRAHSSSQEPPRSRLAVIVPAHNEERLIGRCVQSLGAQSYPAHLYRVIVVADNCSDDTASTAEAAGAEVMVRVDPDARGKGRALRWAMDQILAGSNPPDAMVVVDADSVADHDLLWALEAELRGRHDVVQADYTLLVDEGDSPRNQLIAAGFLLFHRVRFSGRARLGMPANLVGNGMLFSRHVVETHPWNAFSGVEDLEYSTDLRMAGIKPRFAPAGRVSGPGPASRAGETSQRMRWEGGRFHVVRTRMRGLVGAAIRKRDVGLLEAALDLATPPLGLLCMALTAGLLVVALAAVLHLTPAWALLPWAMGMVAVPAYVVIGLHAAGAPESTWRAVLTAPLYIAWKVVTYARLARGFDASRWDRSDRPGEGPPPDYRRLNIAGVPVDPVDIAEARRRLRTALTGTSLFQVSTVNLDFLVRAQTDAQTRRIFETSNLNVADGAPVVWLGRLLGADIAGRVAGADLVPAVLGDAAKMGSRVFLLGGENGVAAAAGARMLELYPGLVLAGTFEPPRAAIEDMDNAQMLERITEARPDLLLVGLGHPKQERWIDMHRAELPVAVAIGVGCVLELIAGRSRRAPRWMRSAGLEWAYRLAREPRRLFSRYLTDAAWLIPIAAKAVRTRLATPRVAHI